MLQKKHNVMRILNIKLAENPLTETKVLMSSTTLLKNLVSRNIHEIKIAVCSRAATPPPQDAKQIPQAPLEFFDQLICPWISSNSALDAPQRAWRDQATPPQPHRKVRLIYSNAADPRAFIATCFKMLEKCEELDGAGGSRGAQGEHPGQGSARART